MAGQRRAPDTKLTLKEERFLRSYFNSPTPADIQKSYRAVYECDRQTVGWIKQKIHMLVKRPEAQAYLAALRKRAEDHAIYDHMMCDRELHEAFLLAMENRDPKGMIAAALGKAKIHGLIEEKRKEPLRVSDIPDADLARQVAELEADVASLRETYTATRDPAQGEDQARPRGPARGLASLH